MSEQNDRSAELRRVLDRLAAKGYLPNVPGSVRPDPFDDLTAQGLTKIRARDTLTDRRFARLVAKSRS